MKAKEFKDVAEKYSHERPKHIVKGIVNPFAALVSNDGGVKFHQGSARVEIESVDIPRLVTWLLDTFDCTDHPKIDLSKIDLSKPGLGESLGRCLGE